MILVTGSNGQLGQELQVLANNSDKSFLFVDVDKLDITDESAVDSYFKEKRFTHCINCAAYTAVDKAESDRDIAFKINCEGAANLAMSCQKYGAVMIQISTDFVFNGNKSFPYEDTDIASPLSVYGESKLCGEKEVLNLCAKTIVLRTSWLYSTFGNNYVKTMLRLGKDRSELKIIYDQIGTPTYAADLANVIFTIIEKVENEPENDRLYGVFHYSNEGVASWYDFSVSIFEYAKLNTIVLPIKTEDYPLPAMRPKYSVLDKGKIKEVFGLTIPYWRESLKKCTYQLINS